jgi:DNA-directed RNA polymerase subunit alpha
LILEVATNGSIEPIESIINASSILETIFASFTSKDETISQPLLVVDKPEPQNEYDNIMLEELELSVRAYNCLKRANVHSVSELLKYSQEDLLEFKNFGQKSADEVCWKLENRFGISLPKIKI